MVIEILPGAGFAKSLGPEVLLYWFLKEIVWNGSID